MKNSTKSFIFISLFFLFFNLTFSQPSISLSETAVDFGDVYSTGKSSGSSSYGTIITITNNGTAPLIITSIKVEGKNFSFSKRDESKMIPVGKSQDLGISFLTESKLGRYSGVLMITHNASDSPTKINLSANCVLKPEVELDIDKFDFDDLKIGTSQQKTLTIVNLGTIPAEFNISSIFISGGRYENRRGFNDASGAYTLPNKETKLTIPPGEYYELKVEFSPTKDKIYNNDFLFLKYDHGDYLILKLIGRGIE